MENFIDLLARVVTFLLLVLALFFLRSVFRFLRKIWLAETKNYKMLRMIEKLRESRVRFRLNNDLGVIAICRNSDFNSAIDEYTSNVGVEQGQNPPWHKVSVRVKPTFTFASGRSSYCPAHTGIRRDFITIFKQLIEELTGESTEVLSEDELSRLMKVIVIEDGRLFVPFAGNTNTGRGAEMFQFYGYTTTAQAMEVILGKK